MEKFDSESRKKTYIITSASSELSTLQVCIREVTRPLSRRLVGFSIYAVARPSFLKQRLDNPMERHFVRSSWRIN